ncbi:DUF3106 domain-containing protein [Massilia soli]|uniref:DUF3106 domain-containing protein n=1 Tax=Massilia soli TaxID=2792854 RepID=A0ABS7SQU2_9BURK|nr:DUF3106 domain-containing protein [Massilia soli]MBZ2208318.1 DUF3106 domain-containing protein [Massilia soli]
MIVKLLRAAAVAAAMLAGVVAVAQSAPPKHGAVPSATKPSWAELTPAQQMALSPLKGEWNTLEAVRKQKWLEIANRFSSMQPGEQQRMHDRMRDWVKLTPEQRKVARENYARVKKIDKDERSAKWQQYQQLPEEQKQKLAADAARKRKAGAASPKPGDTPPSTSPAQPAPPAPNAK